MYYEAGGEHCPPPVFLWSMFFVMQEPNTGTKISDQNKKWVLFYSRVQKDKTEWSTPKSSEEEAWQRLKVHNEEQKYVFLWPG